MKTRTRTKRGVQRGVDSVQRQFERGKSVTKRAGKRVSRTAKRAYTTPPKATVKRAKKATRRTLQTDRTDRTWPSRGPR